MEFDSLGQHCQHANCHQKDFLPFTCEKCGKNLCLIHRSEVAHQCEKKDLHDMTSMDCPVCKKSFKFSRADDPNAAWELHFSTSCTQQPEAGKPSPQRCAGPACRAVLGPSNRFQCPKCHRIVCLSCRTPESHQCSSVTGKGKGNPNPAIEARLSKFSKSGNSQGTKGVARGKSAANGGRKVPQEGRAVDNTLKGSAQRRMQEQQLSRTREHHAVIGVVPPAASSNNERFECPLCSQLYNSSTDLVQHVASSHPQTESSTMTNAHNANATREVCPTCSQSFPDLMSLIHHAEQEHSGAARDRDSQGGRDDKCRVC